MPTAKRKGRSFPPSRKRQNSGEDRPRRLSSEDEYTTDDISDEEGHRHHQEARASAAVQATAAAASATPTSKSRSAAKPRRWQPQEDRLLTAAVNQSGEANWKAIAAKVGSRNHVQCLQRWKKVLRPGLVKGQWSAEEDALLMKLATAPFKNWGTLSTNMPGRTSKQCRERWCHHLDPGINKSSYSHEEDEIMLEIQGRVGNKWSLIAAELPGRTENSIKIRCKALQRQRESGRGVAGRKPAASRTSAGTSTMTASPTTATSTSASTLFSLAIPGSSSSGESGEGGMADHLPPPDASSSGGLGGGCEADHLPPPLLPSKGSVAPAGSPLSQHLRSRLPPPGPQPVNPVAMFRGFPHPQPPAPAVPGHVGSPPATRTFGSGQSNGQLEPTPERHSYRQQQQQQQQRNRNLTFMDNFVGFGPAVVPSRNASIGDGDGDEVFNDRLALGNEYHAPPPPLQLSLPLASDFNRPLVNTSVPAAQRHVKEEENDTFSDQHQANHLRHADDELVAEVLAAVSAADLSSPRSSMASLDGLEAVHLDGQDGSGQCGGGGDDCLEASGCGEADAAGEGNRPLPSCCSFLALNAQNNMVGDMVSWAGGKDDDDGGALMI